MNSDTSGFTNIRQVQPTAITLKLRPGELDLQSPPPIYSPPPVYSHPTPIYSPPNTTVLGTGEETEWWYILKTAVEEVTT